MHANKSTQEKISLIFSGSATPACDLLVLVENGEITAHEATNAMKATGRKVADVRSAAADEIEYMRRHDI